MQITHQLADCEGMSANLLDARLAVVFKLLRAYGMHFGFEIWERIADDPFPTRDGDIAARRDGEDAATHRAERSRAVGGAPVHNGGRQNRQQIRVTGQYAKAAALILGPN